ncbi:hypothetical protein AB0J63_40625 [Streptosporangium canum]|uniref:hypothetical protein n=1 Tax=Streptosporangium canum TaxID=324952 RepID=UPI003430BA4B
MHVTVFGAVGNMGSRVVPEALARAQSTADVVRDLVRTPAPAPAPATAKGE